MDSQTQPQGRGRQGFASMDAAKQRAIAAKGGSAVPPEKRPFAATPHWRQQRDARVGAPLRGHRPPPRRARPTGS